MKKSLRTRAMNEISHGRFLAESDTEKIWGWDTPAGLHRAARRADLILKASGVCQGMKVLEVGCGTGLFTELFSKTGCHILAVDISPELLSKAKERNIPPESVTFLQMPFEESSAMGPFDAVIGSSILHHLDVDPALKKIYSLLGPGGKIAFAEPNMLNPQVYLERRFSHWRIFSYTSPDETAFLRWRISNAFRDVGFTNVRAVPFDWLHPSTPGRLIPLVKIIGSAFERLPLVCEFSGSLIISATKP